MTGRHDEGGEEPSPRRADGMTGGEVPSPPPADEATGLPGLPTWKGVYLVVLGVFAVWIGLLTLLTRLYS